MYTFTGITEIDGAVVYGVPICLYRRSTFELLDVVYSTSSGTFDISTDLFEDHYIVALSTISGTYNAIVYDWIHPKDL